MKALKRIALFALCITLCMSMASCTLLFRYINNAQQTPGPDLDESYELTIIPGENSDFTVDVYPEPTPEPEPEPEPEPDDVAIQIEKLQSNPVDLGYATFYSYNHLPDVQYKLLAETDGNFAVWIDELYAGNYVELYICDHYGNTLEYKYVDSNGEYAFFNGVEGTQYIIRVVAELSVSFQINFGEPKAEANVSDFTTVSDRTQFPKQKNIYTFVPTYDGVYRFEFGEIMSGNALEAVITNRLGETVASDYYIENGEGVTATLKAGEEYTISVMQVAGADHYAEYVMYIGNQKPTVDISGIIHVADSTEFTDQTNVYTYTADKSGTYTFDFSEITKGAVLEAVITNRLGETVVSDYYIENGETLEVTLNEGQTYTVTVKQVKGYTDYTLTIN